jgi:hypothetical protein
LAAAPPPQALLQRHWQLAEIARLGQQVQKLQAAGRVAEALAPARRWLALERELFGPDHEREVAPLLWLGFLHEARADFATARTIRQEVLAIQTKCFGKDHWQVTESPSMRTGR